MSFNHIIKEYFQKNKLSYIIGFIFLAITCFIQLYIPKLIGNILDYFQVDNLNKTAIKNSVFLLIFLSVIILFTKMIWRILILGNGRTLESFTRDKFLQHLFKLPIKFYHSYTVGDLTSRAANDINAIRMAFTFGISGLIDGILINIVALFVMTKSINLSLTLLSIIPVIISSIMIYKLRGKIHEYYYNCQKSVSNLGSSIQESIYGIRIIKSYNNELILSKKITYLSQKKADAEIKYYFLEKLLPQINELSFCISFIISFLYGGKLVLDNTITIGDLIAFNSYLYIVISPFLYASKIIEIWQKAFSSMGRLNEILKFPEKQLYIESKVNLQKIKGKIEFRNLNFDYNISDNNFNLSNICITLMPGKSLGIIGKIGSGKSTLVETLIGLYEVPSNSIFIDDIDITLISTQNLREIIGYVPQENFLFSTSIKNNISYFQNCYTTDEIIQFSKVSNIYDDVMNFPNKFDTLIGENGITLSGGQKQRVSISRSLIKKPKVYIFDDCLSSIDLNTESIIKDNIKKYFKDSTGIIVSHRISTIMNCDEIIYLEDGKIVERGTHNDLLKLNGKYRYLFDNQSEFSKWGEQC